MEVAIALVVLQKWIGTKKCGISNDRSYQFIQSLGLMKSTKIGIRTTFPFSVGGIFTLYVHL